IGDAVNAVKCAQDNKACADSAKKAATQRAADSAAKAVPRPNTQPQAASQPQATAQLQGTPAASATAPITFDDPDALVIAAALPRFESIRLPTFKKLPRLGEQDTKGALDSRLTASMPQASVQALQKRNDAIGLNLSRYVGMLGLHALADMYSSVN